MKHRGLLFGGAIVTCLLVAITSMPARVTAHPFLNTSLQLSIEKDRVGAAIEIPVTELGVATKKDYGILPDKLPEALVREFEKYIRGHFKPVSPDGKPWVVAVSDFHMTSAKAPTGKPYQKLAFNAVLTPPSGTTTRTFSLGYDAVVREENAHSILVSIRKDWQTGVTEGHARQAGIISYDFTAKRVRDVRIDVSNGNLFTGYIGMVRLGMEHIRSGTDHLLFLLTLLLPAPLLLVGRRWAGFAGTRRTVRSILVITTAFTVGHSITLIIATVAALRISSQPIEALIAFSIIVSAVHALRPLFPGKELWVAAGFGLIHGTAFSFTLAELNLDTTQMLVSLLGFNIGIELMQLIIIAMVMPPLIVFARTPAYRFIRIGGAVLALMIAIGWLMARLGFTNPVGTLADGASGYAVWLVVALIAAAGIKLLRDVHGPPALLDGPGENEQT